jgi:hypothetical protein
VYQLQRLLRDQLLPQAAVFLGREVGLQGRHSFVEKTNTHDLMPDIDEFDPICPCPPPPNQSRSTAISLFGFGAISFRAPYRMTPQGLTRRSATRSWPSASQSRT